MGIWLGPHGIEVEALVVNDRPCLRVTRLIGGERVLVADCADVREVGRHVDLAQLVMADSDERQRFGHIGA
ncbi:hypothetical protein [Planomonospora parontospora]|uniref:hypothetical protein n=1 Tax=Planomonospora parontospora TaxID=58119 RepID=UPI00166F943C|nr:hypothetical protein [Planomonospora parontospora]GGL53888.1 hypothetical protein GCM10014719_64020 [Planomonospora parontospora subsp. antibiotica]GII19646.1 hypothetical protein Ppa05_63720 [Planomonospora parontospora subsp. antibiotica]